VIVLNYIKIKVFCKISRKKLEDWNFVAKLAENCLRNLYKIPTEIQKSINNLIGGINKIVDALGDLRNKNSDAHGVGSVRIKFKEHHARLIANTARTLCEFLLSVITNKTTY
jgi:hypothetical protein